MREMKTQLVRAQSESLSALKHELEMRLQYASDNTEGAIHQASTAQRAHIDDQARALNLHTLAIEEIKQTQERVIQQMGTLDASARQERESRLVLEQLYNHLREMTASLPDQQQAEAVLAIVGDRSEDIRNQVSGFLQQHVDQVNAALKELATRNDMSELLTMLNKAVIHDKLEVNPLSGKINKLVEDNVRQKVLSHEDFESLILELTSPLREMFIVGFFLCMRQGEIIKLSWSSVDLDSGFIRLVGENTKNKHSRNIPIHPFVLECFKNIEKKQGVDRVFLSNGKPIKTYHGKFQREWKRAVEKIGLEDFHFHDSRHCSINNLRLAQNDYFRIMAISGHKTMSVFKRYNYVTEDELRNVNWLQK